MHAQLCLTLCDTIDYSPPAFSVLGILQVRILEWVAISFSRGSSWSSDQIPVFWVSCIGKRILYYCTTREATKLEKWQNAIMASDIINLF